MPIYEFVCVGNPEHVTTKRTRVEDESINCAACDIAAVCEECELTNTRVTGEKCEVCPLYSEAKRREFYEDTSVHFPGVGFTKTSIPPAPPKPNTTPGEPTGDWFEKLDEFADKGYHDDENVRPYRKEQAKKMIDQMDRGALA